MINANTVGTEILKSLVLPGIRAFTIIDDHLVTEEDYDSNFFLCMENTIGKPRASVAAHSLLEMNDDVKMGEYIADNFETLLDKDVGFFSQFTIVIACNVNNESAINKLSRGLWSLNVPLLLVRSIGYLGYIRLQVKEHTVIEPHPDNHLEDLRLDNLFPALKTYLTSFPPLNTMSRNELTRIPSLVVIYVYLQEWRRVHQKSSDDVPSNYREKQQLASLIKDSLYQFKEIVANKTHYDDGEQHLEGSIELENFEEAIRMSNKVFINSRALPSTLQTLLADPMVTNEAGSSPTQGEATSPLLSPFWIMVTALKEFINKFKCLPLPGQLPDMNCASEHYIQLQKVYKVQAQQDVDELLLFAEEHLGSGDAVNGGKKKSVRERTMKAIKEQISTFAKNTRYLSLVRTKAIADELSSDKLRKLVATHLQNGTEEEGSEHDELRFYLLMRLVDRFHGKHNRYPGQIGDIENDVLELKVLFVFYLL